MTVKIQDVSGGGSPFVEICQSKPPYSTVVIICKNNIVHSFCTEEDSYKYATPITEDTTIFLGVKSIDFSISSGRRIIPNNSIIEIIVN